MSTVQESKKKKKKKRKKEKEKKKKKEKKKFFESMGRKQMTYPASNFWNTFSTAKFHAQLWQFSKSVYISETDVRKVKIS